MTRWKSAAKRLMALLAVAACGVPIAGTCNASALRGAADRLNALANVVDPHPQPQSFGDMISQGLDDLLHNL